jgi:peptide/nickel transport system substrate-binding protein
MTETTHSEVTRRQVLMRFGAGGAALALPGLLAACGSSGGGDGASRTSTGKGTGGGATDAEIDSLTWSLGATPETLDIATGFSGTGTMVMALGLEGLLAFDARGALQPLLAESWSRPSLLRYVYKIREGVTFWDGTPLTAEDVAFSLARHADPRLGSQFAVYFGNVKSVKVTGPREVTVIMSAPDPLFEYVPTLAFITPKAYSERLGKKLGTAGPAVTTMGTGPFRFTSFGDSEITLERNERYWGEKPPVRAATLKFIADAQANLLAMRAHQIDGIFDFPLQQAPDWDRLAGVRTQYAPGQFVTFLSFDVSAPPWNDVHVRRAVAYACDRAGYVRAFLRGHGRVAKAVVAPESWGSVATPSEVEALYARLPDYAFDVEAAKAELAKSAHPDGFTADIDVPTSMPAGVRAIVSLSETLKQIGIDLRVHEVQKNAWIAKQYEHKDLGLQFVDLIPNFVDPSNLIPIYLGANAVPNNFNTANYRNPQVDRLIVKQAATRDDAVRTQAIGELLSIVGDDLPYFPLWWQDTPMALDERFAFEGFDSRFWFENWMSRVRTRA